MNKMFAIGLLIMLTACSKSVYQEEIARSECKFNIGDIVVIKGLNLINVIVRSTNACRVIIIIPNPQNQQFVDLPKESKDHRINYLCD